MNFHGYKAAVRDCEAEVIGLARWAHRLAAEASGYTIPSWDTLSDRAQAMWIKRARESGYVEVERGGE